MSGAGQGPEQTELTDDVVTAAMVDVAVHALLKYWATAERLYLEPIRAGWFQSSPSRRITAAELRDAPKSDRARNRADVSRWLSAQHQATKRRKESILYDFLVDHTPAAIEVVSPPRGRGDAWPPPGRAADNIAVLDCAVPGSAARYPHEDHEQTRIAGQAESGFGTLQALH